MSDINSLKQYYAGIKYIFENYKPEYNDYIINNNVNIEFEKYMITNFNSTYFKVLDYSYVKNFCNDKDKYPDCGETTARNLINLICFDIKNNKFDISILE